MIDKFTMQTVHYAHICIITAAGINPNDADYVTPITQIAERITQYINRYRPEPDRIQNVEIDPEFKCNALTEVGLRGTDRYDVQLAARMIVDAVEENGNYYVVFED